VGGRRSGTECYLGKENQTMEIGSWAAFAYLPTSNRSDHRALLLRLLTLNHVDLVCRTSFSFQLYSLTTNFISSSVSEKILSPSSKERVDRNVTRKATVDDPLSSRTPPSLAQADVKHNSKREITHGYTVSFSKLPKPHSQSLLTAQPPQFPSQRPPTPSPLLPADPSPLHPTLQLPLPLPAHQAAK